MPAASDLVVASAPVSADALARIGVRHVALTDDGALPAGADGPVTVAWRRYHTARDHPLEALLDSAPALRWIHQDFVGTDGVDVERIAAAGIVLTTGQGNYTRPMAEWVVLGLLQAVKRLPAYVRESAAARWDASAELGELDGLVVLMLGLGSVNALAARMLEPFGADVRAWVRTEREAPPGVAQLLVGPDAWRAQLPHADAVVLGVPLTDGTRGMLDADALAALKPGATLVNVARGGLVDEPALVRALDAGTVGSALLDAFAEEPLPADHPLWRRDDVVVVPHHTWSSPRVPARTEELFTDGVRRWLRGEEPRNRAA